MPIFLAVSYFIQSNYLASILLIIFAVFSSSLAKLFRFIIGRSDGNIHPLLFIIGVFVGFYSLGFFGFLTGPIIFGVLQIGLEELFKPK